MFNTETFMVSKLLSDHKYQLAGLTVEEIRQALRSSKEFSEVATEHFLDGVDWEMIEDDTKEKRSA